MAAAAPIDELGTGLFHWQTRHPRIPAIVSSYWLDESGVAIDPLLDGALSSDWFAARPLPPVAVLLSNRHHYRSSGELHDRFGCPVLCNAAGLHEFTHGERVEGFEPGETLPGPALAIAVGALCADETALYLPRQKALVMADAVVRDGSGVVGFVPDSLMDEPAATKRGILAACARLLDDPALDFRHLLLAHGGPLLDRGRETLRGLVDSGGRTAFEL